MTDIREPNFTVDLPGEWVPAESTEAGALVYREVDGSGSLVVLLLGVRPVYAIADQRRLLEDYLKHRSTYELAQDASMPFSAPFVSSGELIEGGWEAADPNTDRRARHRCVLVGNLLADFRFETAHMDAAAFDKIATALLGGATVSAGSS